MVMHLDYYDKRSKEAEGMKLWFLKAFICIVKTWVRSSISCNHGKFSAALRCNLPSKILSALPRWFVGVHCI